MNPFAPGWAETGLRPLADRARAGESGVRLGDALFAQLWPWALATAERMAQRVPPGADRDAVRGEVLAEVFQATRRVDWDRYGSWPALLRSRLHNAWSAAARAEDPLSRRQRAARRAFLAAEEAMVQRLGRTPTPAERRDLAMALNPRGPLTHVLFGAAVVARAPGTVPEPASADDEPSVRLQRLATQEAVQTWIDHDLPVPLAAELRALLARDEGDRLGHSLRQQVKPFLRALRKRLAEQE